MRRLLSVFLLVCFFYLPVSSISAETKSWVKTSLAERRLTSLVTQSDAIFVGSTYGDGFSRGGVHRSRDGGSTWELVGLAGTTIEALFADETMLLATTRETGAWGDLGIYRSTDGGNNWQHVGPRRGYTSFAKQGSLLFAGSIGGGGEGVYRSTDNGVTWTQAGLLGLEINTIAASETSVFALTQTGGSTNDGLYRSTDSGVTWVRMALGSPTKGLYADSKVILAAVGTVLLRSTDDGVSFQGVVGMPNIGSSSSFGPITSDGSNYYLGSWRGLGGILTGGVLRSVDRGVTWQAFNDGLDFSGPTSVGISTLGFVARPKKLYVSARRQGLWEYSLVSVLPPVILMAGFTGSEFVHEDTGQVQWVDISALLSQSDSFLDVLKLKDDGKTAVDEHFVPGKLIEKIDFPGEFTDLHFFDILKQFLVNLGYEENINLFLFGYDWRRDISPAGWLAGETNTKKKPTIERLDTLISSLAEKPILVVHSMGGLVARQYILDPARAAKVDTVVTLGTPWKGVPLAFVLLHYGRSETPGLNRDKAQELVNNFPAIYEILPTRQYIESTGPYFIDQTDRDADGLTGALNFEKMQNLIAKMHNGTAQTMARAFYDQGIGDWSQIGTNGVKVVDIVGTGVGTAGVVREWYETTLLGTKTRKQSYTCVDGDGTIPLASANVAVPAANQAIFYAKDLDHGNLLVNSAVHDLIKRIISHDTVQENSRISKTPQSTFSGSCVKVFSPVALHIYDQEGNHNGPLPNGDTEVAIANSNYDILDESKIAILPGGKNYRIELLAETIGSFDLAIDQIISGQTDTSSLFNDIPLSSASTSAMLNLSSTGTLSTLSLDSDGDGSVDQQLEVSGKAEGTASLDVTPPKTTVSLSGQVGKNDWFVSSVSATLTATDASGSGILETRFRVGTGEPEKYTLPFSLTGDTETTISAQSIDNVGNSEDPVQKTLKIDKTAPLITITSPGSASYLRGSSLTLIFNAVDTLSGIASISAKFNNQPVTSGQKITLGQLGKQTLVVTSEDRAGNGVSQKKDIEVLFSIKAEFFPPQLPFFSKGSFVTTILTMPTEYSADEVDIPTVRLEGIPTITKPRISTVIIKQKKQLRVDFDSKKVIDYLKTKNPKDKDKIPLLVQGRLLNGLGFQGKTEVTVKK